MHAQFGVDAKRAGADPVSFLTNSLPTRRGAVVKRYERRKRVWQDLMRWPRAPIVSMCPHHGKITCCRSITSKKVSAWRICAERSDVEFKKAFVMFGRNDGAHHTRRSLSVSHSIQQASSIPTTCRLRDAQGGPVARNPGGAGTPGLPAAANSPAHPVRRGRRCDGESPARASENPRSDCRHSRRSIAKQQLRTGLAVSAARSAEPADRRSGRQSRPQHPCPAARKKYKKSRPGQ